MDRTMITSSLVDRVERLLAQAYETAAISADLGVTSYVVAVIANDRGRPVAPSRSTPRSGRRTPNSKSGIDACTIRMIQRMLAVGVLNHKAIAREAGVSPSVVNDVAAGRRNAVTTKRPYLSDGEQFLPDPIRCGECGSLISVAPCRACGTRHREKSV